VREHTLFEQTFVKHSELARQVLPIVRFTESVVVIELILVVLFVFDEEELVEDPFFFFFLFFDFVVLEVVELSTTGNAVGDEGAGVKDGVDDPDTG
jgi:hypothetical protein